MKTNTALKDEALSIFNAGLKAVDPKQAIVNHVRKKNNTIEVLIEGTWKSFSCDTYHSIYIVGAGKATAAMCQALEEIIADQLKAGIIVVKEGYTETLTYTKQIEASHPVPDERGMLGTQQIKDLVTSGDEETLIFALISGGGSALLPLPADEISLPQKQEMTNQLLSVGADITEINTIRKHISAIKGGMLARHAAPATIISLILSDVVGDPLSSIASGPTVPDTTTFQDAYHVLEKYKLLEKAPRAIVDRITAGRNAQIADTPKKKDPIFKKTHNVLIGTNYLCLQACENQAASLGYNTVLLSSYIEGESKDIGRMHAAIAKQISLSEQPINKPACIISGGETTVTLQGKGKGGRNTEFVLSAAMDLENYNGSAIFSAGTDGGDGPTDAAGAICFGDTIARAKEKGLNPLSYLQNNDSYTFFNTIDDLIKTGPTNTNVMDAHFVLVS